MLTLNHIPMGLSDTSASPYWSLSKGMYSTLKVTISYWEFIMLYTKPGYTQWRKGSGIWGRRNLKSWVSLLKKQTKQNKTNKQKKKTGKNKKVITSTPGRKLRSRELKVCRFSVQACQEEKQTQPHTRDRTITWEAAISSSSSSCSASSVGIRRLKLTSAFWENTFKDIHTAV